jgi:serine/threonine-protein kinase RsbT
MKPALEAVETSVSIQSDSDIVAARQQGRALAERLGFSPANATILATAISELARNILLYAGRGEIILQPVKGEMGSGLAVVARDDGPGIQDIRQAMMDGFSASGRLGLGLPGVRRLMDDFEITSRVGHGTTVTGRKWNR